MEFNPGLPADAYRDAVRQIVEYSAAQSLVATNRDKYALLKDGVQVTFRNEKGELVKQPPAGVRLRRAGQQPLSGRARALGARRPLPPPGGHRRVRQRHPAAVHGAEEHPQGICAAYEKNLADYKDTVPHLFHHNAFIVIAKGSRPRSVDHQPVRALPRMEAPGRGGAGRGGHGDAAQGRLRQANFIDLVENFIVFDESAGETVKIVARNHQLLGVNRAIDAV